MPQITRLGLEGSSSGADIGPRVEMGGVESSECWELRVVGWAPRTLATSLPAAC